MSLREIREYPLPLISDHVEIEMPRSAEVVGFGENDMRRLCVWAIVEPDRDDETHAARFCVVRSGQPFASARYVYVARCQRGLFTLHLLRMLPGT